MRSKWVIVISAFVMIVLGWIFTMIFISDTGFHNATKVINWAFIGWFASIISVVVGIAILANNTILSIPSINTLALSDSWFELVYLDQTTLRALAYEQNNIQKGIQFSFIKDIKWTVGVGEKFKKIK